MIAITTDPRCIALEAFLAELALPERTELQAWIDGLSEEDYRRARWAAARGPEAAGIRAMWRFKEQGYIDPLPEHRIGTSTGRTTDLINDVRTATARDHGDGYLDAECPHCQGVHRHAGGPEDSGSRRHGLCGGEYRLHVVPAGTEEVGPDDER